MLEFSRELVMGEMFIVISPRTQGFVDGAVIACDV